VNVACARLALWVLARADASGAREALVGDLIEEIARGRPQVWVWQQVIGLCGFALAARARRRARVTPHVVALAITAVLFGGGSIASLAMMLEIWVSVYMVAGTLSLFAHVMARTATSGPTLIIAADAEAPRR
jgi:hypothetical protein